MENKLTLDKNGCECLDIYCWKCTCNYDSKMGHDLLNNSTNNFSKHFKGMGRGVYSKRLDEEGKNFYDCDCGYSASYNERYLKGWRIHG